MKSIKMIKSVSSNIAVFLVFLILSITSNIIPITAISTIISMCISFVILSSFLTNDVNRDGNLLGFILLKRSKRIFTDYGKNFWVSNVDNNLAFLIEDKFFRCKIISKLEYNGNVEYLKSQINKRLDIYCGDIKRKEDLNKKIIDNFNKWDGCLTKVDSRDKKISDIF